MIRIITIFLLFVLSGCAIFMPRLKIEDVIAEKEAIDKMDNPAMQYQMLNDIHDKKVIINDIVVKKVVESSRVDYSFCVLADIKVNDKDIECHIYSHSINTISKLEKSKTVIDVSGTFERFFSTLDEYYTKIEIIDASIKIKSNETN